MSEMKIQITHGAKPISVSFVRFVLHKNHTNRKNQYNQVYSIFINHNTNTLK